METVWEFIKGLGALVGLATGAFVLWERVFRDRPLATIVPAPLIPGSATIVARLRIVNRTVRPVLIFWQSADDGNRFRVSRSTSIKSIIEAAIPGDRCQVVQGEASIDLELFKPPRMDHIDDDNIIEAEVYWQFAQPVLWQRPRRLPVRIKKSAFLRLLEERDDADD